MATQLEDERKEGLPSIKFRTPGQQVIGMVVDRALVPWYEFNPTPGAEKVQKIGKNGKPREQEKITVLVMDKTTAVVTDRDGNDVAPEVGTLVNLFLHGQHRWAFIEAKESHGPLSVGDVIGWKFTGTEQGVGASPKKITAVVIRKPKPEEAPLAARAEHERKVLRGLILETEAPFGDDTSTDDDGFFG